MIKDIYESKTGFAIAVFLLTWVLTPVAGCILGNIMSRHACDYIPPGGVCDAPGMMIVALMFVGAVFGFIPAIVFSVVSFLLPRNPQQNERSGSYR